MMLAWVSAVLVTAVVTGAGILSWRAEVLWRRSQEIQTIGEEDDTQNVREHD